MQFLIPKISSDIFAHIEVSARAEDKHVNSLHYYLADLVQSAAKYAHIWDVYAYHVNLYNKLVEITGKPPLWLELVEICRVLKLSHRRDALRLLTNRNFSGIPSPVGAGHDTPVGKSAIPVAFNVEYLADVCAPPVGLKTGRKLAEITLQRADQLPKYQIAYLEDTGAIELVLDVILAIITQQPGGFLIVKTPNYATSLGIDMIAILSSIYAAVYLIKPVAGDLAKSYVFIVCRGLAECTPTISAQLRVLYAQLCRAKLSTVTRLLNMTIPLVFTAKIEEYRLQFGQQQIDNIHSTVTLILNKNKETKLKTMQTTAHNNCVKWCKMYM